MIYSNIMKHLLFCLLLIIASNLTAQTTDTTFATEISRHRQQYKEAFLNEPRSPLTANDTIFLDFFAANADWKLEATFTLTPDAAPFDMPTYSGRSAEYRKYGELQFEKNDSSFVLCVYQNLRLLQVEEYQDYLFIPFKDPSNGTVTYGGGRYIECRLGDLVKKDGQTVMILDFNKCFNPYCAYSDGYNCPVPPRENHLPILVTAGEKHYKGEKKH